jgi:arylsulfatase
MHHLGGGTDFAADRWELYHLDEDFSEYDDLASAHPEKLTELVSLWWAEAGRYGVLPLEDRLIQIAKGDPGRDPEWKDCFSFLPGAFIPDAASCPDFFNRAFTINAVVEHSDGAEGVLFAFGDRFAGFVLFVQDGRLRFDYNGGGRHSVVESSDDIAAGPHTVSAKLDPVRPGVSRVTLAVDSTDAGTGEVTPTMLAGVSMTGIQCGRGFLTPVSDRYENPFRYGGTLREVVVTLEPKQQDADIHAFATVMADQ